jgi:methyl-accepting chemotaxis protein
MKPRAPLPIWRKIYYVNPQLQGIAALVFAAVIAAGGVLFGVSVYLYLKHALGVASLQGHYTMRCPYEVVREGVAWHAFALFAGVSLVGTAAFLLLVRATERGLGRVVEVIRASAGGDLSTPTKAPGLAEFRRFGGRVDDIRGTTLAQIREIRDEAASLADGDAPREDFRLRWDLPKQKIRKVAP